MTFEEARKKMNKLVKDRYYNLRYSAHTGGGEVYRVYIADIILYEGDSWEDVTKTAEKKLKEFKNV